MKRLERDDHLRRRAVRAADDAPRAECCVGVHFGDDERDIVVHSEVAALVDHLASGIEGGGQVLGGDIVRGRRDDEVCTGEGVLRQQLDRMVLPAECDCLASRPLGREEPRPFRDWVARFENRPHDLADRPGRTNEDNFTKRHDNAARERTRKQPPAIRPRGRGGSYPPAGHGSRGPRSAARRIPRDISPRGAGARVPRSVRQRPNRTRPHGQSHPR